jgi:TatD DNase family protein
MDAYHDAVEILKEAKSQLPNLRGDMHFFAGGLAEAQAFIALGFTLSFTAVITFARGYDEVIKSVPLTSILAETDSPYVAPASRRGKRNDPLVVPEVMAKIAESSGRRLRDCSYRTPRQYYPDVCLDRHSTKTDSRVAFIQACTTNRKKGGGYAHFVCR